MCTVTLGYLTCKFTLRFRYMIQNERLGAIVTSYKSNCSASEYVDCMGEAFKNIQRVIAYGK